MPLTREELDLAFALLNHELQTGSYWERRLTLRRRMEPPRNRFLYKYRSVDPLVPRSIDQLRDILVRSRLWLSAAPDFNDPFDMGAAMIVTGTRQAKKERAKTLVARLHGGNRAERRQKAKEIAHLPRTEVVARGQQSLERTRQDTGIASFTIDPRNIQMWSYYAAKHEGCCLQFELARDPVRLVRAVPVEYDDNYPTINYVQETLDQILPVMLRKQTGWHAERERRIVIPGGARTYLNFHPDALSAIIFGCRIPTSVRAAIDGLLAERTAAGLKAPRLYVARQHPTRYALVVEKAW